MTKELINKKELSNYLGFSVGKIDNLIKNHKIEYYKIGKNIRFNINEIKEWVSSHKKYTILK